jgi:hypothetical protein
VIQNFWSRVPKCRWDGAGVDRIIPSVFLIRKAAG